jgi:hypothetical protein
MRDCASEVWSFGPSWNDGVGYFVMAGLVPAIHVCKNRRKDVDARDV